MRVGTLFVLACDPDSANLQEQEFFSAPSVLPAVETTIGDADAFGSIESLAVLPSGAVVVSDGMNGRLKTYVDGREVHRYGRLGEGPEEFSGLGVARSALADTLIVHDSRRFKLDAFRALADTLVRLHDLDLPFSVGGVCTMGGRIFALGTHDGRLVHETNTSGELVNSFAEVEGTDAFDIALNSLAEIACSSDVIALASRVPGDVRIFSSSGTLVLRDSIPDFVPAAFERRGNSIRPLPPPLGFAHAVKGIHSFGSDLMIQLTRTRDDLVFESRWLSGTGAWMEGLPDWPRILALGSNGLVYAAVDDPFPVIRIYRIKGDDR